MPGTGRGVGVGAVHKTDKVSAFMEFLVRWTEKTSLIRWHLRRDLYKVIE